MNNVLKYYLQKRFVRFLIIGFINTVVGYGTFALGIYVKIHYYIAYIFSYVVGITSSYIGNKLFTFKSKRWSYDELGRFVSVYLISFLLGSLVIYITVDVMSINKYGAGLINLLLVTIISWFGHNKYSFKEKR